MHWSQSPTNCLLCSFNPHTNSPIDVAANLINQLSDEPEVFSLCLFLFVVDGIGGDRKTETAGGVALFRVSLFVTKILIGDFRKTFDQCSLCIKADYKRI
jgi:hypothetical protein